MWKMWKSLKRKTRISVCEGAAIIALGGFIASAYSFGKFEALAPLLCAAISYAALWFFAFVAGWFE